MKPEDIKNARQEAEEEIREEWSENAKVRIKDLLQKIDKSKKVTANLERELEELELELSQSDV